MATILNGETLTGGSTLDTRDAFGTVNGKKVYATQEQLDLVRSHIQDFVSPHPDLREPLRRIEHELLAEHAGVLIGNQALDFHKQDGVTEIEEAIMANTVEARLNDLLLLDEEEGRLTVNRAPIFVSCVSNFTNFLDLFRKTVRSLEVGIPCVVLARSNTEQHAFRWTKLLVDMLQREKVDPGMLTFLCCDLEDIKAILRDCQDSAGNLYTTCSRDLAETITNGYPKTIASTGGPNTLVSTEINPAIKDAIQMSASIESSGQCTALRHCVVPSSMEDTQFSSVFDTVTSIADTKDALEHSKFDGVFAASTSVAPSGYEQVADKDAYFRVSDDLPGDGIEEHWRQIVVDFSKLDIEKDSEQTERLTAWLNKNQPISLAINAQRSQVLSLGIKLWEKTGMVVNTLGSTDSEDMPPALTCQARPQEGEIFGEFPPRTDMYKYTKFPVVVPSSNPSYDALYTPEYLSSQPVDATLSKSTRDMLNDIANDQVRGYCMLLINYLRDVSRVNPKTGTGKSRTAVYGIQRPPLGSTTLLCCSSTATWDEVAPMFLLFHVTNARDQIELLIDPNNTELVKKCISYKLKYSLAEGNDMAAEIASRDGIFNTVCAKPVEEFVMVGNFVSLLFPLGHIKVRGSR